MITFLVLLATLFLIQAIGLLGHLGTLLAHIQLAVNQHPQVLFRQAAFQPLFPKPVALHGVAVAQVQDPALGLVEPHTIGLSPLIQPVQIPLQSLPTLKQINTPTQLGVICKLTEGALDLLIQIIDKDIKQNWPQHRALGNTTCDWLPTGVNSIHHHSLGPAIQPVLYPAKRTPVQAMSSQSLQENAGEVQWQEAGSGVPAGRGEEGRDLPASLRPDGGPTRVVCKLGHGNIKRASNFKDRASTIYNGVYRCVTGQDSSLPREVNAYPEQDKALTRGTVRGKYRKPNLAA
ncbi:hypothetical protein QYF61_025805 [Mycteria americana]|uniref:Uncharacterized protein n=1 Tax=Mycteria americana TaxID=33587 RepID=A0AAN7PTX9_MYCAM|nr:hypothetical protein QYF61_025805 [Mycteria americana]